MLYALCYLMKREVIKMEKLTKTVMVIFSVAILFVPSVSIAGSLEPPAGSFDASGPLPTMKTLDHIPPTWSLDMPANERFVPALPNHGSAVLDRETGLVWQSAPFMTNNSQDFNYYDNLCRNGNWNNKSAWRLPTLNELRSLFIDYNTPPATPYFSINPADHIAYWTITPDINDPDKVWYVDFSASGSGSHNTALKTSTGIAGAWCVRGPLGK
jgi:hypothetical protein